LYTQTTECQTDPKSISSCGKLDTYGAFGAHTCGYYSIGHQLKGGRHSTAVAFWDSPSWDITFPVLFIGGANGADPTRFCVAIFDMVLTFGILVPFMNHAPSPSVAIPALPRLRL